MTDSIGTWRFGYNANSQLTSVDGPWPKDTITYVPDDLGRISQMISQFLTETIHYPSFSKIFSYTSDAAGLNTSFIMPDGPTYSDTYDAANRLTSIRLPGVGAIDYPSYTMNRPDSMTTPSGSQSYQYGALMRLKDLDVPASGLVDYAYTYDNVSHILTKQTEYGNYGYGYDDVYRLLTADNPTQDDEAYTYDNVGNRETASGVTGTITHNANNELAVYGDTTSGTTQTIFLFFLLTNSGDVCRVADELPSNIQRLRGGNRHETEY